MVGIYSPVPQNIPEKLFYSLFALQHRGQESAGIAYRRKNKIAAYKDLGMVSTVLARYLTGERSSRVGIGHVRYSTHGGNRIENAQPVVVDCNKGKIALAHNGNISNALALKGDLVAEGSIFQSTSDTELLLHLIARSRKEGFLDALTSVLSSIEGAYSMVMIHEESLVVVRDPLGFRPLYLGRGEGMVIAASETCALDILKVRDYREVEPGEIVVIDEKGERSLRLQKAPVSAKCIFELIYFSRPDSMIFGESVHMMRKRMGAALAETDSVSGDIVVPVPDSGNSAALGYAERSGIPFEMGLTRNHYTGRSFILPTTSERELAVRMKLHPVRAVIEGKSVILIDDSLVRGTTSKILVRLLRDAGAREVHLRLCSPELKWPCYFGIDIPTREELISNSMDPGAIASFIEADTVRFLQLPILRKCLEDPGGYCFACFSGNYPVDVPVSRREIK